MCENRFEFGPVIGSVAGEPKATCRDGKRGAEGNLPDEKKGNQPSPALGAVAFAKITIGSSRTGERCAEFRRDKSIADGEERAQNPSQQGLRTSHSAQHKRHGDE